jgi:glycerol-3-phosphate acyltransferase PlsX
MLGVASPRVGLMTIGTEEGKGNALITETHELLKRVNGIINYAGPIEGFQVFAEHVDVVVCDGFVGNIMLKSWESLVKIFLHDARDRTQANPLRKAGAIASKGAFAALKERINPERYGGAPLLGLRGNILKAHGSATATPSRAPSACRQAKSSSRHSITASKPTSPAPTNVLAQPTVA